MIFAGFTIALIYKIIQTAVIVFVVYMIVSILSGNPKRRHAGFCQQQQQQRQHFSAPPPPPPPPRQPPPPPPPIKPKRRFGCQGCLGVIFLFVFGIFGVSYVLENADRLAMSDVEKRIEEIKEQKKDIDKRLKREIPDFVRLLYRQAREIKHELEEAEEESRKSYLMDELEEIARTFVFLDQEESDYQGLLSELASIERTLIRLKESEKLFGAEYDDFMNQSRSAMIKARAKLKVKIDQEIKKDSSLSKIQIQEKMDELLQ